VPAGAQNGASEASFCLDARWWLFVAIEALVASGRPVEVAHLLNTSGAWKLNDIG
jgi:hypothetical protein